ncbi:hypothetical protein SASC598O02_003900 [Snodgrassella alvi SCGC AB-598-O02]|nr:hypothetical protein SASC598O02_003900 [Snodgrassella alvi SCGC AB-598-O02]
MKKIMSIGAILALLLLSACATTGSSGGGNTEVYGEVKVGVESSH